MAFTFTENFLKSPTNFSSTHVRICVKDATPLLEPGKIWLYKVVTIYRHLYGGVGGGGRGGGEFVPTSIQTSVKFKQL